MPWNRRRSFLIVLICFLQIVHFDFQRVFAQTASMLQPAVQQNISLVRIRRAMDTPSKGLRKHTF